MLPPFAVMYGTSNRRMNVVPSSVWYLTQPSVPVAVPQLPRATNALDPLVFTGTVVTGFVHHFPHSRPLSASLSDLLVITAQPAILFSAMCVAPRRGGGVGCCVDEQLRRHLR